MTEQTNLNNNVRSAADVDKTNGNNIQIPIVGVREKLIILFLIVKVIPLILLAMIAWRAINELGTALNKTSVEDSRNALTAAAVENIERITFDAAQKVAEFLYSRDADISFLATICNDIEKRPDSSLEQKIFATQRLFEDFSSNKVGKIRRHGEWNPAPDDMSWVQSAPYIPRDDKGNKRSLNVENNDTVDGASFRYRPPYGFEDSRQNFVSVPLYDEIALLDKDGNQIIKYINPDSTKKRYPFTKELVNIADHNNTYIKAEKYFAELSKLGKDGIYVSDVIGAYVPSHFIGMYTSNNIASKKIDAKIAELEKDEKNAEIVWKLHVLNAELKNEESRFNSKQVQNKKIRDEIDKRLGVGKHWKITSKSREQVSVELKKLGLTELADAVLYVPFAPENEAYAGAENPKGIRFEGIVRWVKPVSDKDGSVSGYVTFALNHDHLIDMIAHITPMNERYSELSNAYDGNYAFIWDYNCRSIVHPRHHSICGFNPETGKPETPWLEQSIYEGMINAGYKREDWQDYIATLKDYTPWIGTDNKDALSYQSRTKKPAAELTKLGLIGLDGRYLNNAPQCTGWMDLARDGGSGSLYILWSGVYKLNTAAAIPYYTGQYSPDNRGNRIGFGFVAVGAGIDDFSRPADEMGEQLTEMVNENLNVTFRSLVITTLVLSIIVIFVAIWMASYLSNRLQWLIDGITKFRYGDRYFRFATNRYDEFGRLARSFDDMADSIVLSVHTPLVITDMNLKIIYANDQCLNVMGKQKMSEVVNTSYAVSSVYPYGTAYCPITVLQHGIGSAAVYYDEHTGMFLQGNANYITDENGRKIGYIITSNDVTELSLKQLQLEKANAAINLANRHKSDFLAQMSHELRTPMNAIIGINNIAQSKIRELNDSIEFKDLNNHLLQLEKSSTHLLSVLNDILDISNLETGSIELFDKPLDLNTMLNEIEGMLRLNCKSKGLELDVDVEEFSPSTFVADGLRLRQALNNILNNAVKYTKEGGRVQLTVKRKKQRDGKALLSFTVRDSGIGISEDMLESIFRPFEQGNDEIRKLYGGSGLGLAITQQILKLFGSEIKVNSELGKGSEFNFEVWLTEDEDPAEKSGIHYDVKGLFKKQRALIIDDVRLNRVVLVSLLKQAGFITDEAVDGSEGLKKFAESSENFYNVIFMDIQMPIMDGYTATESIRSLSREDSQKIPIVAISANSFKEDIDKSIASGMDAHHAKPITMETLSQILMKYCKPTDGECPLSPRNIRKT